VITKNWASVLYVFLFGLGIDNFLENISCFSVPVLSVPLYQPILRFVLRLLHVLGGRRLRAGGEKVFHREFARVSTGMSVWIWAELVIADPVTFGSPVFVIFLLV
jgi:hypothetical protein